jgi:hypothetical protein
MSRVATAGDVAPALHYRNKDVGIPAALGHPLIKNQKVGEQAGEVTPRPVRLHGSIAFTF